MRTFPVPAASSGRSTTASLRHWCSSDARSIFLSWGFRWTLARPNENRVESPLNSCRALSAQALSICARPTRRFVWRAPTAARCWTSGGRLAYAVASAGASGPRHAMGWTASLQGGDPSHGSSAKASSKRALILGRVICKTRRRVSMLVRALHLELVARSAREVCTRAASVWGQGRAVYYRGKRFRFIKTR